MITTCFANLIGRASILAGILILLFVKNSPLIAQIQPKSVRFVYLISQDREYSKAYAEAIERTAQDLQKWYRKEMKGASFKLNTPIVEIAYSNKNAAYFYAQPNGENPDNWGFNNTLAEVNRLLGTRQFDPNYIWVVYSDGPGNSGRGGSGVCIMPEDDLLGLIGKHPSQKDISRWIAGAGHELGHAFGLPHPKDTEKHANALMWTGIYGKYPDQCYLTEEDKKILKDSPFFFYENGRPIQGLWQENLKYEYEGGFFTLQKNDQSGETRWLESKKTNSNQYIFKELKRDPDFFYLKSINRTIQIKIPRAQGKSYLSADQGKSWRFFGNTQRVK